MSKRKTEVLMGGSRGKRLEQTMLTAEDVHALAGACNPDAPTGARNAALVYLLAATGLRISEALALLPSDYRAKEGIVRVQRGKGGRQRTVPVTLPAARHALAAWMAHRKGLGLNGRRPIFCTLKGEQLKDAYVRELLPRLGRKADVEGRIHAHAFRHHFASTLSLRGVSVRSIQVLLGHSNLSTTDTYLRRIAPAHAMDEAVRAMREAYGEDEATG